MNGKPYCSYFLPPRHLFPTPDDLRYEQALTINDDLRSAILKITSRVFNSIQDEPASFLKNYDRMERLYEYVDEVVQDDFEFAKNYRLTCVSIMWHMGAVVWKQAGNNNVNPYMERVSAFLKTCLLRLGWNQDVQWRRKLNKWKWKMETWKKGRMVPAAYHAVDQFVLTHNDLSTSRRTNQLDLMLEMATTAHTSSNSHFLEYMYQTLFKSLQVRLKDRHTPVRILSMTVLSKLIKIDSAKDAVTKQMKYYTRYDPSIEVRRIGTKALAREGQTKIRFFFDQAFDKSAAVRAEAYRALGMLAARQDKEIDWGMSRLKPQKLCKLIVWGLSYSDSKCSALLKQEVLPNWLKYSCGGNLIQFLSNLDAYENMKAVLKVLDIMMSADEQMRFVENLDFGFIKDLKLDIVKKQYSNVTIEAMVAWLSLCKASEKIESIRGKVVPTAEDMLVILQSLHECAFLEHDRSQLEGRVEDVSPIVCNVVALQITKFVVWEEGGRRTLQTLLRNILLDPLFEERALITQAMYKLYDHMPDKKEFEDVMTSILQDVFEPRSAVDRKANNSERRRSSEVDRSGEMQCIHVEESLNAPDQVQDPEPEVMEQEDVIVVESVEESRLAEIKQKLQDLALSSYCLSRKRDALIAEKKWMDAVAANEELSKVKEELQELSKELKQLEELAGQPRPLSPLPVPEQLPQNIQSTDMDEEDEPDQPGIVKSVKGIFMINTYLDLMPDHGLHPFFRNFYDNFVSQLMADEVLTIRQLTYQFLIRVALVDKRELKKIANILLLSLLGPCEWEIKDIAFKGLVDLIIRYDFGDFVMNQDERDGGISRLLKKDLTKHLQSFVSPDKTYDTATALDMSKMLLEVVTTRFPPANLERSDQQCSLLMTSKTQGILKLFVAGYIREPTTLGEVIMLWVNHDYSGTPVLRDLENVLNLYNTFKWWGSGKGSKLDEEDDLEYAVERTRILGMAIAHATVLLCEEGIESDAVIKFVSHLIEFVDQRDQSLMRAMSSTILTPVLDNPFRSNNPKLVQAVSFIPLTAFAAAKKVVQMIDMIFMVILEHTPSPTLSELKNQMRGLLTKFTRVHGQGVLVLEGVDGKKRKVGKDFIWRDDESYVGSSYMSFSEVDTEENNMLHD